jgi:competence protein ComEC
MIRACLLLLAGGFAAQHSRVPLSSDLCKLLLVASILMLAHRRARYPGCALLGFVLFFSAAQEIVDGRLVTRFAGDSLLTQVRIVDFPKMTSHSVVMLVEPIDDARLPARSRVSWYEPAVAPSIGDVWELELRLKRPRGASNPGVFDVEAWMFRNKIQATGYVVPGKRNRLLETGTESGVDGFRRQFVSRATKAASSPEVSAVIAAVGVGARHQISREQWHRYALSGTSHLMAISGLHIGLAATAAFLFARAIAVVLRPRGNAHIVAIGVGVLVATVYAGASGFGVPAQRASLMLVVAAGAIVRRRKTDPLAIVAVAAFVIFILDPVATMTPGFSLSFSAVVLLLWRARFRESAAGAASYVAKAGHWLRQLATLQVSLFFGLMPLTVLLFDRVAFLATPVNLIAIPLFSLLTVPFTLVGLVLGDNFGRMGHIALQIAAATIERLESLIEVAVRLPFADTTVAALHSVGLCVAILPVLLVMLPRRWPGRYVAVLAVGALLLHAPQPPDKGCVDLHVLDVGQGLAAVLQTHSSTLLFDTGPSFRGGASAAEQIVVPFLKSRGIRRIDWLVVSHADIDHSGGVRAIYEVADVSELLVGEPLRDSGFASSPCLTGRRWATDEVRFRLLHPDSDTPRRGNDSSCVVLIEVGRHGLLLTGDIEADAEREIIESRQWNSIETIVVPHHGSLTSSSVPFISAVSPNVAIVSAGYGNRWGFPKAAVVARWQAVGARVLNTATSGAVSLRLCADSGIGRVRLDRHERRRFWRDDAD